MWHYAVIQIETLRSSIRLTSEGVERVLRTAPCWNLLYQAPIDQKGFEENPQALAESAAFSGCQVWIEQNKVEGSKYAIMKMFIV